MSEQSSETRRSWLDWLIAAFLFFGTAAVVVWQNSRVGVLWDISYILENAFRISVGDVPYRDFPFPYAPLTFLTQAAIIRLTGAAFWHHILYCAIVGGIASALTWRILLNLFRETIPAARLAAFLLASPLTILGIYCIFPHPFYDPDCTFVILLCILFLLHLERKGFPPKRTFFVGILLVVPVFVKQNTGLAFLAAVIPAILMLVGINIWRRKPFVRGYIILIGGAFAGLAAALALVHLTAGLENYRHWTIEFAAARRTPPLADMLAVYQDPTLLIWVALLAGGAILLRLKVAENRLLSFISIFLMSAPFAWSVFYLFLDADASERAERLFAVFPFVIIVSFAFAVFAFWRRGGIASVLPFVLIATIHGAFLSQQLWGSTYALWSLLIILIASTIVNLFEFSKTQSASAIALFAATVAAALAISGAFYVYSNERLDYANLSEGDLVNSQLPQLKGLSVRGSFLPDFEELVNYADKEIPAEDGILMLPGEDLFYYTTGRRPRFPVLMFDRTVNPYSSEEILEQARRRDIRWLIVKNELQLDEEPFEDKKHLLELLRQDFRHVESLNNYEIYKRKTPGAAEAEADSDEPDGDDSDDTPNN